MRAPCLPILCVLILVTASSGQSACPVGIFNGPAQFVAGGGANSIAVGDYNEDGHADLAVVNSIAQTVSILLGDGNASYGAPMPFPVSNAPCCVAAGDLNDDGHLDLAVINVGPIPTVSVL